MVKFRLVNGQLGVLIGKSNYTTFNNCIQVLKDNKFRYNPTTHEWIGSIYKRDTIKEILENYDVVEDRISKQQLEVITEGTKLQFVENPRRIPDYSLMNYLPIIGKHPYENFQKDAISRGINSSCRAYFYGMGSGKSFILSTIIAHRLYKYHDVSKVILITSNIGVRNLYYELFKFIKGLDESKVAIADKNFRNPFDDKSIDIIVTSYSSWRLIADYYKKQKKITSKSPKKPYMPIKEWADGGEVMLALDESHNIANPMSIQTKAICVHAPLFKYRYLFSGTPADKPEKLYSQYNLLDPYLVYNLTFVGWKEQMGEIGTRFSAYEVREWKKEELEKQNQRFLQSYGEYYKTTDLIDLPEYNEKRIYLKMSPSHRRIYEGLVTHDLSVQRNVRDTINRFPYLMLSVDDPSLLIKHEDKFDYSLTQELHNFKDSDLEKYNALADIIEDHPDDKILVWVIHPSTATRICERFKKYNPLCIIGETKQEDRFDIVNKFKTGNHKLLVCNITTMNSSVTITEARVSVYFERGFNYTEVAQSQNRNYRIGQEKDVESYVLIYDKSLDCLLDKNLQNKGLLVSGLNSRAFISMEDWSKIFNCTENEAF